MSARLTAAVLDPASRPTAAELPALAGPAVVWDDDRWWRFTERTDLHEVRYLAVYDGGSLVALAPLLLTRDGGGLLFYDPPAMAGHLGAFGVTEQLEPAEQARWTDLEKRVPEARPGQYPSLAMAVFGSHFGLVHAGHRTAARRREVLARIPDLLDAAARELGCRSSALLYTTGDQAALLGPAAEALGYAPAVLGAEAVTHLTAGDWDGHLAAMGSHRRTRTRRELREYAAAGFVTVAREGPGALAGPVVDLQVALRAKYGLPGGRERVRRDFDAIRETMGDDIMVLTAEKGGEALGFVLYLRAGDTLYARTAGFDDERARGCYFTLTYHETIRWALDHGVRSVWYGLASYEAKKVRGCDLAARWGWFRFTGEGHGVLDETVRLQGTTELRRLHGLDANGVGPIPSITAPGEEAACH